MARPIVCPRCQSTRVEIVYRNADVLVCACGVCQSQFSTFPPPPQDALGREADTSDGQAPDSTS